MNVYIAKFENRPGLVKIGIARDVSSRMAQLSKHHGKTTQLKEFPVGDGNGYFEKFLHQRFADRNQQLVRCDGYTEFFCESVESEAEELLQAVIAKTSVAPKKRRIPKPKKPLELTALQKLEQARGVAKDLEEMERGAYREEKLRCAAFVQRIANTPNGKLRKRLTRMEAEQLAYHAVMLPTFPALNTTAAMELGIPEDIAIGYAVKSARSKGNTRVTHWRFKVALAACCSNSLKIRCYQDKMWEATNKRQVLSALINLNNDLHRMPTRKLILDHCEVESDRLLYKGICFTLEEAFNALVDVLGKEGVDKFWDKA